jgi:ribosomal protein L23
MKLIPVLTEKSLKNAKDGICTFYVDLKLNKYQIKEMVEETFDVNVVKVRTMRSSGEVKRTMQGRKKIIRPKKKAIVILKEKEKIDIFENVK